MFPTFTAATIEMGAPGGLAYIHPVAHLGSNAQYFAHDHPPLRAVRFDVAAIDVMGNHMCRFVGDNLGEKFLGVLLQKRGIETDPDRLAAPLPSKDGLAGTGASQVKADRGCFEGPLEEQ